MEQLDAAEERAQTEARQPFHSCGRRLRRSLVLEIEL